MKNYRDQASIPAPTVAPEQNVTSSRRQWPREVAAIPMTFVTGDRKRRHAGHSKDVSLGGIALKLDAPFNDITQNMDASVELNFEGKIYTFACKVLRTQATNVFVAMDENRRAQFASLVSLIQLADMRNNVNLLKRWDAVRNKKQPAK